MSDEKQITLEKLEELLDTEVTEGSSRNRRRPPFQTILAAVMLNWYWFLLSLVVFVGGALIYLRYAEPVYSVSARMLIKNETKKRGNPNQMLAGVENLGLLTNTTGIDNEVEMLQSRVLLREVVKDLKLYTEYRKEDGLRDVIVYNVQPVNIDLDPLHLDSLDYNLLEKMQWIDMKMWKEDSVIVLSGKCMDGKKEGAPFTHRLDSLPGIFATELGTITVTPNPGREWIENATYLVTISPPMAVATSYLAHLSVAPTSNLTTIAELSLTDKNYRRGMDVLRQLTVCYNRQANADKNEVALRTEEFINERMMKINEELGSTEGEIQRFKQQQSVTSIADASQSVQMSNAYSSRLAEAQAQVNMLDYMCDFVNNPNNKYQIIPSNIGVTDAASTTLITRFNQAVLDRNRLLQASSEQAPQVRQLTATINELQQSIQTALQQARRNAEITRQGIQTQIANFQGRISAAPLQERILNQVGRQQNVKSTLYMLLLQKREENSIELAATADNGRLIDEPLFRGMVSPKRTKVLVGSFCLGLLVPGIIIWLLSLFRYKIEGHEDVVQLTDLPIIADVAIASDKVKQKAGIVVQANKNTQIDEIFRSMRTNIQFMLKANQKVICFTSSSPGEGKTFNAANLAVSFALLGKKVILCGLDIRRPALGHLFGIKEQHHEGITTLLTLEKVTKEALFSKIRKSEVNEHLDLLLAGSIPPNPAELLARENFADIVNLLRENYDYVIFDTAPVGLVTDTLEIGKQADITVFICRADFTPKSSLALINALAEEKKMPNPCVVLNGIDMSRRKYSYYYGYGKYSHYGYSNYGRYVSSHYGNKDDDSIKR